MIKIREVYRDDFGSMMCSAVRYALGRRTYIVGTTVDFIINNMSEITDKCKRIMLIDIRECKDLGDDCDEREWIKLKVRLERELLCGEKTAD